MWVGIAVFVLLALTTDTVQTISSRDRRVPGAITSDYGPLAGRLLSTVVVTAGLIYTFRDKKRG